MKIRAILFALILSSIFHLPSSARAQSVAIRVVANDGSTTTTNVINLPAVFVSGLIKSWQQDSERKTNASPPAAALPFGQFIAQELTDKGQEWNARGGEDAAKAFAAAQGFPNLSIPPRLSQLWSTLTPQQRTNAIQHLNLIGQ